MTATFPAVRHAHGAPPPRGASLCAPVTPAFPSSARAARGGAGGD